MRTLAFEQDDAYVFCREDDALGGLARLIELLSRVYSDLSFAGLCGGSFSLVRPRELAGEGWRCLRNCAF
jgi:threonyl-tRNA synthetase